MSQIVFLTSEIVDIMAYAVCMVSVLVCNQEPDASRLFTIWIFMGVLHSKLFACPEAVRKVSSAWTSLSRCAAFFESTRASGENSVATLEAKGTIALSVRNGSFGFIETCETANSDSLHDGFSGQSMKTILVNVNLDLERKRLYAVVGRVGSGKTSLLLALMAEMQASKGTQLARMSSCAAVAYVPQDPIIFNDIVRENICFGQPFDVERYRKVCSSCALDHDLSLFPEGDASIIGSRGINISGGQQARICLARALYSNADMQLLDDPLAKLDARVSAEVLSNAILGFLGDRTRIMVTHSASAVRQADFLIRVDAGTATLDCRLDASDVELSMCSDTPNEIDVPGQGQERLSLSDSISPENFLVGNSVGSPEKQTLMSRACFFWRHLSAGLSSPWHTTGYVLVLLIEGTIIEAGIYFLSIWSDDPHEEHHTHGWYGMMYSIAVAAEILIAQSKFFCLAKFTQRSVDWLLRSLLICVLRSSFSWIQGISVGHILQLFSGSTGRIDDRVFHATEIFFLSCVFLCLVSAVSCLMFPPFAFVLLLLGVAVSLVTGRLMKADKNTKLSESSLRRRLVHQYTETLNGLVIVRNFSGASDRFLSTFDDLLKSHAVAKSASHAVDALLLLSFSLFGAFAYAVAGWCIGICLLHYHCCCDY